MLSNIMKDSAGISTITGMGCGTKNNGIDQAPFPKHNSVSILAQNDTGIILV